MASETDDAEATRSWIRSLWDDAANHLTVAYEATETAQARLEDLQGQGYAEGYADKLQPLVEQLRRAASEAREAMPE